MYICRHLKENIVKGTNKMANEMRVKETIEKIVFYYITHTIRQDQEYPYHTIRILVFRIYLHNIVHIILAICVM